MEPTQSPQQENPKPANVVEPTPNQIQASKFINDVITGKVKVEAPKPKPKGAAGTAGFLLGGMISKDSILLGIILVLILVVIGMSVFVIGAATNPGVQVTFGDTSDNSSQSNFDSSDPTAVIPGDNSDFADSGGSFTDILDQDTTEDVTIMLTALISANRGVEFPTGSVDLSNGELDAEYRLVPVKVKTVVAEGQALKSALEELFGQDDVIYRNISLENHLKDSDIEVRVLRDPVTTQIDLRGTLVPAGDLSPYFMKNQIEYTIGRYVNNYIITLNGSELEYRCFGDQSGICN